MIGKSVPSILIGLVQVTMVLTLALFWFKIPFQGSLFTLYFGVLLFLIAAVGIGLMVSSVAATMQQALLGSFLTIMPFAMLSGLNTPISNMPREVQYVTLLNPLRYVISIIHRVFLEAASFRGIASDLWPLALIAALFPVNRRVDVPPPPGMISRRLSVNLQALRLFPEVFSGRI